MGSGELGDIGFKGWGFYIVGKVIVLKCCCGVKMLRFFIIVEVYGAGKNELFFLGGL